MQDEHREGPTREAWLAAGKRIALDAHRIFIREGGKGPHLTLLHGFPTCSWDWSKVWSRLEADRSLLAIDLLGFGDSDKPARRYSFADHADRLEQLWSHRGVTRTTLVAHDYSVTLALELLARRGESPSEGSTLDGVVLLNGAVRGSLHRARPIQRLLRSPLGPLVARLMRRDGFAASFREVFVNPPNEGEIDAFWSSIRSRNGVARIPSLLHYIPDRRRMARRWEGALEQSPVPISFVWGLNDPVSGSHVLDGIEGPRRRVGLPVGHYPHWEAPDAVSEAILELT